MSIMASPALSVVVVGGAGACPSCLGLNSEFHPELAGSLSQGHMEINKHLHSWSLKDNSRLLNGLTCVSLDCRTQENSTNSMSIVISLHIQNEHMTNKVLESWNSTQKGTRPVEWKPRPSSTPLHHLAITTDGITKSKKERRFSGKEKWEQKNNQNKTVVLWGQQQSSSCQWSDCRLVSLHLIRPREEWPHQAGPGEPAAGGSLWGWTEGETSSNVDWQGRRDVGRHLRNEDDMKSSVIFIQFRFLVCMVREKKTCLITLSVQVALCKPCYCLFSPGGDPVAKLSSSWAQRWTRRVTKSEGFKQKQTLLTPEQRGGANQAESNDWSVFSTSIWDNGNNDGLWSLVEPFYMRAFLWFINIIITWTKKSVRKSKCGWNEVEWIISHNDSWSSQLLKISD